MKRGTPEHPKILDFAEAIHGLLAKEGVELPFELAHSLACGMFERLCHYTARYAPAGDIGKHSDLRIALAVGWKYSPEALINALVNCKILDRMDVATRLYVHDWHDHSDDGADKWLYDKKLLYANGHNTRRGKKERESKGKSKSRPSRDSVTTQSRQSEPRPRPEPKSEPRPISIPGPEPEPQPEIATASPSSGEDFWDEDKAEDWARDIAKQLPPRNEHDARRWCAIAIAAQTTFSEDWFRAALERAGRGDSEKGPYALFNGVLNKAAKKQHVDLKPFLNSIVVQDSLQACLPIRARAP